VRRRIAIGRMEEKKNEMMEKYVRKNRCNKKLGNRTKKEERKTVNKE
jgi:hypothetical protein